MSMLNLLSMASMLSVLSLLIKLTRPSYIDAEGIQYSQQTK